MRTASRYKRETDKSISELWKRIWDLQDQTNKIKIAVLTGEKGDLKVPEKRELEPWEPIPFGGTIDMESIFGDEPFDQTEKERQQALKEIIQCNKRSMNSLRIIIVFSLVMLVVNLSYLFYQISIVLK